MTGASWLVEHWRQVLAYVVIPVVLCGYVLYMSARRPQ